MPWNHIPMAAAETMKRVIVILSIGCRLSFHVFPVFQSQVETTEFDGVENIAQLFERPAASSHFLKYGKPDSKPALPEQPKPSKNSTLTGANMYKCTVSKCAKPTQHLLQRYPNKEKNRDHDQGSAPESDQR